MESLIAALTLIALLAAVAVVSMTFGADTREPLDDDRARPVGS